MTDTAPKATKPKKQTAAERLGYNAVPIWAEEYKRRYHVTPPITGRDVGQLFRAAEGTTAEMFRLMCRAYLESNDRRHMETGHRVDELYTGKNRWYVEASQ